MIRDNSGPFGMIRDDSGRFGTIRDDSGRFGTIRNDSGRLRLQQQLLLLPQPGVGRGSGWGPDAAAQKKTKTTKKPRAGTTPPSHQAPREFHDAIRGPPPLTLTCQVTVSWTTAGQTPAPASIRHGEVPRYLWPTVVEGRIGRCFFLPRGLRFQVESREPLNLDL